MESDVSIAALLDRLESIKHESSSAVSALADVVQQVLQLQHGPSAVPGPSSDSANLQALRPGFDREIRELKEGKAPMAASSRVRPRASSAPVPAPVPWTSTSPDQGPSSCPAVDTKRRGRNLVVCIDGTSNQFSTKNTNVVELYHRLIRDKNQLTFYNSGIGTYATPSWKSVKYIKQVLKNKIDLAIAWNFEAILLSAYRWLSENYEDGDVIYLFGFSRGAYQIRTLSAMIHSVGLLRRGNLDQIPFAFELYAETKKVKNADTKDMCQHFKDTFSEKDVKVHFAGAWDTVSSVGLFRNKTLPGTTDGMQHVTFFRHALALHERRVKFLQENVRGGLGPEADRTKRQNGDPPHTKEVWFAGSHGDIGGGAVTNLALNQFGPSLRWMLFEASVAGLRLTDAPQHWESEKSEIHNSMSWPWLPFEVLPFVRLNYGSTNGLTWWPHFARPRIIKEHQLVHSTALESSDKWRARLPEGMKWNNLNDNIRIEHDPYTAAKGLIENIKTHLVESHVDELLADVTNLKLIRSTEPGVRSLRDLPDSEDALLTLLDLHSRIPDSKLLAAAASVANAALSRKNNYGGYYSAEQRHLIAVCTQQHHDSELGNQLRLIFPQAQVRRPLKHPGFVFCVAYMPGGDRIVTGCYDGAVRVWDLKTGTVVGAAMTGHASPVWSVAVSPDGAKIASGSADKTIRLWSAESGATRAILRGHEDTVRSVAFSPNGLHVVSGSGDRTIRVWDVKSAKTIVGPIEGHTTWVFSVAYSPDGSRIVSGSDDATIRVWVAETGEQLWHAEMSSTVYSVAYSPDGQRIVAGCSNRSVRILDAETGTIALGPLAGHTNWVNSVAFSPDSKKIASGSDDRTVRLWDAETGVELDVLRGHRNSVQSVAFSPDGKYVASASWDDTVRVWDATGAWKNW